METAHHFLRHHAHDDPALVLPTWVILMDLSTILTFEHTAKPTEGRTGPYFSTRLIEPNQCTVALWHGHDTSESDDLTRGRAHNRCSAAHGGSGRHLTGT